MADNPLYYLNNTSERSPGCVYNLALGLYDTFLEFSLLLISESYIDD